ncbi:MAG TPA: hypothetical protein VFG71_14715 [Nitrospiraceae bacterium]|nr:hypothetical protein [Nitrospiraceae bacterium]
MKQRKNLSMSIVSIMVAAAIFAGSSAGFGQGLSASPSETVRGQIMKIDGQSYVIQDATGKEVRIHVDGNTMMMDGTTLQEGDSITADVTAKGQASYIIPGPAPSEKNARTGGEAMHSGK